MISRFFWLLVIALLAVTAHISYVLFLPRLEMRNMMEALKAGGVNTFRVYSSSRPEPLTGRPLKRMIYGGCLIEPGSGRVEMTAEIPRGYWSVTVYSPSGNVVYTLNDRHADVKRLNIVFRKAQPEKSEEEAMPRLREGKLLVPIRSRRVVALVQAYVAHPGMRRRALAGLRASLCRHDARAKEPLPPS